MVLYRPFIEFYVKRIWHFMSKGYGILCQKEMAFYVKRKWHFMSKGYCLLTKY